MLSVALITNPEHAIALTEMRRRILEALDQTDSATGLAGTLGATRQKVNYHLRELEKAGFVELAEVRQRRGLKERVMRRTSDVVLIDPAAFSGLELERPDAIGLSGVIVTAASLIRQSAAVGAGASKGDESVAAATLDGEIRVESPARLKDMLGEIAEVVSRYDSPTGLELRVTTTVLATEEG